MENEAQQEEEEYVQLTERNKQRVLQEKQSKLNAVVDAATLSDEHKDQVGDLLHGTYLVDASYI